MGKENLTSESRFNSLRGQLDNLGYHYEFSIQSLPLLELLVADLLQTTDTLRHYKLLSQNTLQACRDLEVYADSYREENEKLKAELKNLRQIGDADIHLSNGDAANITEHVGKDVSDVGRRLVKEYQNLKERCSTLTQDVCDKENRLQNCKQEITKLRSIVENKNVANRPALRSVNHNGHCLENEILALNRQNVDLRNKLEKALLGQQEAKHNAMKISEKYKELEEVHKQCKNSGHFQPDEKMKTLEEEVSKLKAQYDKLDAKGTSNKLNFRTENARSEDFKYVQEIVDLKSSCRQLEKAKNEIENQLYEIKKLYENIKCTNLELEKDLLEQKRLCQEREADKDKLKKLLCRNVDEMKISADKLNRLKIIERDLTLEIDRLNGVVDLQKRHIVDLQEKVKELFPTKEKKPTVPRLTVYKKPLENRFKSKRPELTKKQDKSKPTGVTNAKTACSTNSSSSVSIKSEAEQYLSSVCNKYDREIEYLKTKRINRKSLSNNIADQMDIIGDRVNGENQDALIGEKNRLLLEIETYKEEIKFLTDKIQELNTKNENLISTINEKNLELERKSLGREVTMDTTIPYTNVENNHTGKCMYCSKMEKALTECDTRVCKLEIERTEFLTKQRELYSTIECNNQHICQLRNKIHHLETELRKEKSDSLTSRTLYEKLKVDAECNTSSKHRLEVELKSALNKVTQLECDRDALHKELCTLQTEQKRLKQSATDTANRKQLLLTAVDEKTERLVTLEKLLETRESYVKKLEQTLSDVQRKLDLSKSENAKSEEAIRKMTRDVDRLKSRLNDSEKRYQNVIAENKRLQSDLTALSQDYAICRSSIEKLNKEASDLRIQVHDYIEKVRTAEETLREKDTERAEMLEHFRTLTREAKQLENNNHSLESEAHSTRTSLQSAENKIYELEHTLQNKDALLSGYEQQLGNLTRDIARLEITARDLNEEKKQLELDLTSCRELCSQMDSHRDTLSHSVSNLSDARQQLEDKCSQLEHKVLYLEEQLSHGKVKLSTLESRLQETELEHRDCFRVINELKEEIKGLRATIKCLEESLEQNNRRLRRSQTENTEYHKQNMELNRHLLNTHSDTIPGKPFDYNRNTL